MSDVEVSESPSDTERGEIDKLIALADARGAHESLSEHKRLELHHATPSPYVAMIARDRDDASVVGYGHLTHGSSGFSLELVVHPDHRNDASEVARQLLTTSLYQVARRGGGNLQLFLPKPTDSEIALATDAGLRISRALLQLRVALPLHKELFRTPLPATRTFRVGTDEQAVLTVNARAFAGHPDQGSFSIDDLRAREGEAWFDPAGFLLYDEDGDVLGFCWTKIHLHPEALGEIYVIGVDPSAQGRGLGRSLVLAGLDYLAGKGAPIGMLYVDEDNAPAVGLYTSLGFRLDHRDLVLAGSIAVPS